MHVNRVNIENFKAIEDLDFEPKKINLITGRNNTGKSTVLEAIALCLDLNNLYRFQKHIQKIINVNSESSKISLSINGEKKEVVIDKPSKEDVIRALEEDAKRFNDIVKNRIEKRNTQDEVIPFKNGDVSGILQDNLERDMIDDFLDDSVNIVTNEDKYTILGYNKINSGNFFYKLFYDKQQYLDLPFYIHGSLFLDNKTWSSNKVKHYTYLKNLDIKQHDTKDEQDAKTIHKIDRFIKEHRLVENLEKFDMDYLIFKEQDEEVAIPFDFMGDGFKIMIGFLWYTQGEEKKKTIVLVEEPENSMHPGYLKELVDFIIEYSMEQDIQFFITTHDTDLINTFFKEDIQNIEYLKDNFLLLQMNTVKRHINPKTYDYDSSKSTLKELQIDLRGI